MFMLSHQSTFKNSNVIPSNYHRMIFITWTLTSATMLLQFSCAFATLYVHVQQLLSSTIQVICHCKVMLITWTLTLA